MAASLALATALDFDDDGEEFFGMLLPALISLSAHKNSRKRRRSTNPKKKKMVVSEGNGLNARRVR